MSDRKYKQHGYQDEARPARSEHKPAEKKEYAPRGQPPTAPKTFNMPGFREVVRCRGCGTELTVAIAWSQDGQCARCGADLHTCAQCLTFDPGSPLDSHQSIPVRVPPKIVATPARSLNRAPPSSAKPSLRRQPARVRRSTTCSSNP